nr:shikimate kinase [Neosynechococcus sphagnicola]
MNHPLQDALGGINIYLIGMMGSGKTTIGQQLATQLGYRFIDTDALITQIAGQSIADLFALEGEAAFRQLETQVLAELSAYACQKLAIATGGGIVLRRQNWSYLHHGIVVWLDVPVSVLCDRLNQDRHRPLLQGVDPVATLTHLLEQRQSRYAQADIRLAVTLGETPVQVVDRLLHTLPKILKSQSDRPDLSQIENALN